MKLVLIESPGKKEKWQKYLGSGFKVMASIGHVVELAKDGEDALGFDMTDNRVICRFVPRSDRAKKVLGELKKASSAATEVIFATDPDREGECIAYHLARELKVKNPKRVRTSEITETAIKKAIKSPSSLDQNLINAALGRAVLDKLVGFRGSKLIWSLNNGAKSVGRVQSAALHLVCDRERAIKAFVPEDYWSVWVDYAEGFRAFYAGQANTQDTQESERLDTTDDSELPSNEKETGARVRSQSQADTLVQAAKTHPHSVLSIISKQAVKNPPAAFTTSSLQQAASTRLKLNPQKTMQLAQKLYEGGFITYMRTDSTALSAEFCASVRKYLAENDPENLSDKSVKHKSSSSSQEAHEAIRPTEITRTPEVIKNQVGAEEAALYDLIWRRALASLCQTAKLLKTRILTQSGNITWVASGQVLQSEGYLRYWKDIAGDVVLPTLKQGQPLTLKKAGADKKETQPPPRYSEAKLISLMEKLGIGRPSTYAPTVATLKEREYVVVQKGNLVPTPLGLEVDEFMGRALPDLIKSDFTAKMERELDAIASGKLDWEKYVISWNQDYFAPAISKAKQLVTPAGTGSAIKQISSKNSYPAQVENNSYPVARSSSSTKRAPQKSRSLPKSDFPQVTETVCPKCSRFLTKVTSKSEKVKAGHFLKCDDRAGGCGAVMFMNEHTKKYELPYSERSAKSSDSEKLTSYSCPVCSSCLENFGYSDKQTGEAKTMLRCSNADNRKGSCKEVAFWRTKEGNWWSKVYGEIGEKTVNSRKTVAKTRSSSSAKRK